MNLFDSIVTYAGYQILVIDMIALGWFLLCWGGYARYADRQYNSKLNLIRIMDDMRTRWMHQVLQRETRMADATLLGNIMRTISFFASTTILILIGLFTVLGAKPEAQEVLRAMPFVHGATPLMWEVKISLLMLIFIYAFFKLTWSLRQYNYACIVVGAAPIPKEGHQQHHHYEYANRAGRLIGNAGRQFNMGLRAYYFGMAVVSWFLNGVIFMAMTALVVYVVHRREFRSHTVNNLDALDNNNV